MSEEDRDHCLECGRGNEDEDIRWGVVVLQNKAGEKRSAILCMPCIEQLRAEGRIPEEKAN